MPKFHYSIKFEVISDKKSPKLQLQIEFLWHFLRLEKLKSRHPNEIHLKSLFFNSLWINYGKYFIHFWYIFKKYGSIAIEKVKFGKKIESQKVFTWLGFEPLVFGVVNYQLKSNHILQNLDFTPFIFGNVSI